MQASAILTEKRNTCLDTHTHTHSNKGRTEVSFMAHLSVSGSSAVKTWWWYHVWHLTLTLLPQCSFPAQTQPSSLPAQQHPNLSWPSSTISPSPKVFLGEASPGCRDGHMCRPSGHVQSLAVSGCCLSRWHLMAAQNILALPKEPDKITEKQTFLLLTKSHFMKFINC